MSLRAALQGQDGIALGNVVGSNLFSILGVAALIGLSLLASPAWIALVR